MSSVPSGGLQPAPRPTFDHLGLRGVAFLIDFAVVVLSVMAIVLLAVQFRLELSGWTFYIVAGVYLGLMPATPLQATLGKRMMGLRIADTAGRRIGPLRSLVRLAAWVPSIAIAAAGFLLAAFTPRRQALHDLAAGTLVVKREATVEEIAQVPVPMTWASRIGLVIPLALLFLVGHTFVQVYKGREDRGRAITLLNESEPFKSDVAKALQERTPMPQPAKLPRHVRAMSAGPDGTIVIEVADDLFPQGRLMLRPARNAKGETMWTCRSERIQPGLLPAWCRG